MLRHSLRVLSSKRQFSPSLFSPSTCSLSLSSLSSQQHFRSASSSSSTAEHKRVITQLLRSLGSKEDIDEYLKHFGTPGVKRTAVIKVGGEILLNELEVFAKSLTFLKLAGLFPVVIHGAGPQMNDALAKANVEPTYLGGMRVTDESTLTVARDVFQKANLVLVKALEDIGTPARPIITGVFESEMKDYHKLGFVGEIQRVNARQIQASIDQGYIPIITSLGESKTGQVLNINADVAARELAIELQPHKTIFINAKGGWIDDDGTKLKEIRMTRDFERMANRDYTGRQGTLLKLKEIKLLLDHLPRSSSVALTSASQLHREILSNSSSGTICVHGGEHHKDSHLWVEGEEEREGGEKKIKVGLLGARGFVGREVIRLIGQHPHLTLHCASSRALVGQKVLNIALAEPVNPHTEEPVSKPAEARLPLHIDPDLEFTNIEVSDIEASRIAADVDVWILALPNGLSHRYVGPIREAAARLRRGKKSRSPVLIDLSADYRFDDAGEWTYGLPEAPGAREKIRGSTLISNPGCYASGAQFGLLPLIHSSNPKIQLNRSLLPHVFGVSGYSGAGTGLSEKNNPAVLKDNLLPYSLVNHLHEREISRHLGTPVAFMPHVAPYFQGISLTLSAQLVSSASPELTAEELRDLYAEFYENEPLINVKEGIPYVRDNAGKHHVSLGGFFYDNARHRVTLVSTIDNLLKGAATQAIQNINIALDLPEYDGIIRKQNQ